MPSVDDTAVVAFAVVQRGVEHCDVDAFGVVHFSRLIAYFEGALLAALSNIGLGLL